jgi:hypothetical protein
MVLRACSAAALQLLIQSFGANPCAKFMSDAWQYIRLHDKVERGQELDADELLAQAQLLGRWDKAKMLAVAVQNSFFDDARQYIRLHDKVESGEKLDADELLAQAQLLGRWDKGKMLAVSFSADAWQYIELHDKVARGQELDVEELLAQTRLLARWDAGKMLAMSFDTGKISKMLDVERDPRPCSVCKALLPYSRTVWTKVEFFDKALGKGTCKTCRKGQKKKK